MQNLLNFNFLFIPQHITKQHIRQESFSHVHLLQQFARLVVKFYCVLS